MTQQPSLHLRVVDGRDLDASFRDELRPGELVQDADGRARRLPRFFYEIRSWDEALRTQLTPNFGLWELIDVDVREAEPMRTFPRYVPCAITLLATHLEVFRQTVGTIVRIAANGGYRSPGHDLARLATPHSWGTAANIYRIGDEYMDSQDRIEKYGQTARRVLPGIWTRPFGGGPQHAFDHVHIDLGYTTVVPLDGAGEGESEVRVRSANDAALGTPTPGSGGEDGS